MRFKTNIRKSTLLLAALLSMHPAFCLENTDKDLVVATVDGETVTVHEFNRFLRKDRARVFSHFAGKYGIKDHTGFWTTKIDGISPIEMLRKSAMEECVRVKIQMIMARDKGVLDDVSYAAFLKRLDTENRRRKAAKDRGEVIYGPIEYGEDTGFAHWFSLTLIELKRRFAKDDVVIGDDTLKTFYETNKDQYKRPDMVTVHALTAGTKSTLEKLVASRRPDETLDQLYKKTDGGVRFHKDVFGDDSDAGGEDEPLVYELEAAVRELSPGETTDVLSYDDGFMVVQCIERKKMGHYAFDDELKGILKERYIDVEFERRVDSLVKRAKTSIKTEVYNEVRIR